ncbi:Glycine betaine/carnitine/choline ABC transporter, partial [Pseudomonas savastanoi pv. glycinea]
MLVTRVHPKLPQISCVSTHLTKDGDDMSFFNVFSQIDWAQVLHLTTQHITLVGIAVTLAILVGVSLGVLMTRFPALAGPLQASATVLLTVPSIALFGLL